MSNWVPQETPEILPQYAGLVGCWVVVIASVDTICVVIACVELKDDTTDDTDEVDDVNGEVNAENWPDFSLVVSIPDVIDDIESGMFVDDCNGKVDCSVEFALCPVVASVRIADGAVESRVVVISDVYEVASVNVKAEYVVLSKKHTKACFNNPI